MSKKIEITDKDRAEIKTMAGIGMRAEDIALCKGFSEKTLRRQCRAELKEGRATGKATIQSTAFKMANSGNYPAMTIFWLKTRCGFREKERIELTGKNGNPLTHTPVPDKLPLDPIEAARIYQKIMSGS